jgi:hypothetical protein
LAALLNRSDRLGSRSPLDDADEVPACGAAAAQHDHLGIPGVVRISPCRDQPCLFELAAFVVAVAGQLVDACGRQQTKPVVEAQRLG